MKKHKITLVILGFPKVKSKTFMGGMTLKSNKTSI